MSTDLGILNALLGTRARQTPADVLRSRGWLSLLHPLLVIRGSSQQLNLRQNFVLNFLIVACYSNLLSFLREYFYFQ